MMFKIRQFTPLLTILCLGAPMLALAVREGNLSGAHFSSNSDIEMAALPSSSLLLAARDEQGGEAECKWLGC